MANLVIEEQKIDKTTVFDISYYKTFKKYLLLLGQYPHQAQWSRKFNVIVIMCSLISLLIPGFSQLFVSIAKSDMDGAMECVPVVVSTIVSSIKLLNHCINKDKFDKLFEVMKEEWELLNASNDAHILGNLTKRGNKLAEAYRTTLLFFMVTFLVVPLSPMALDVISPLNESRPRRHMFRLQYFIDENEYFYLIYLHSSWCILILVTIIVSIDSLYMLIVYHCCGLFSVCGCQIKRTIESGDMNDVRMSNKQFKEFAIMHQRAIRFYGMIDECSCNSYFLQVGFNMIGITVTAVQAIMYLNQPEEVIRIFVFLVGQKFHLLALSIRGQLLTDYSSNFLDDIYDSMWYHIPVDTQKMLHTMQIRSCKICKLTAGGLYDMNIESFGTTVKACASYFTMLMSLKE